MEIVVYIVNFAKNGKTFFSFINHVDFGQGEKDRFKLRATAEKCIIHGRN